MSRKGEYTETKSRLLVIWGWGGEKGATANGHQASFQGDGNVLKLNYANSCTTINLLEVFSLYT